MSHLLIFCLFFYICIYLLNKANSYWLQYTNLNLQYIIKHYMVYFCNIPVNLLNILKIFFLSSNREAYVPNNKNVITTLARFNWILVIVTRNHVNIHFSKHESWIIYHITIHFFQENRIVCTNFAIMSYIINESNSWNSWNYIKI